MTELLTSAQMRAIERAAIDSGSVTGLELMERAGQGVVDAIFAEWPDLAGGPGVSPRTPGYLGKDEEDWAPDDEEDWVPDPELLAVVLCGPGNNGGDGFVVARLLKERGFAVRVYFFGARDRQPADAGRMHDMWRASGGEVIEIDAPVDRNWMPRGGFDLRGTDMRAVLVDALFGSGLTRPIDADSEVHRLWCGHFADEIDEGLGEIHRVAIDLPSGLCADSGRVISTAGPANFRAIFSADLTVACGYLKLGHVLQEGPRFCGKVVVAPLGWLGPMGFGVPLQRPKIRAVRMLGKDLARRAGWLRENGMVRSLGKANPHLRDLNKYSHGHALVLSGPPGQGGAARLSARGALRIGAGLVTLGCPPEAMAENAAQLNAIMLRRVEGAEDLRGALSDRRINAVCIGPGLGLSEDKAALIDAALDWHLPRGRPPLIDTECEGLARVNARLHRHRPAIVLDADALTLLSQDPALFARLHDLCVLTPHAGEFARLFPDIAEKLAAAPTRGPAYSKVDATRAAAARAGCTVLYKGPDTVIADYSGRCAVNASVHDRAAPWLATAGSGDVLAGFISGLLARGFSPFEAACTAAWLHTECALSFGPGLIAEDLPEELPKVFRALGL